MRADYSIYNHNYSSHRTIKITNSQFDSHYNNAPTPGFALGGSAYALSISINLGLATVLVENITITNNSHRSDTSGIFITVFASGLNMTVKGISYTNNLVFGDLLSNKFSPSLNADFYLDTHGTSHECYVDIMDSTFISNGYSNTSPIINVQGRLYGVLLFSSTNAVISIRNTIVVFNTGSYDAAILVNPI